MIRTDQRRHDELRPIRITPEFIGHAEGSALIEVGHTRVICTATVDASVPPFLKGTQKGWITSEYSMIPRATETRTPREASLGRRSGRTQEIQRLIGRSLRAAVDLDCLGERTIWVDCDVIEADGGTRTASITGSFVAMVRALDKLVASGTLQKIPLRCYVAAVSVGVIDGMPMLDMNYMEDARADVDFNVVMTDHHEFVEIQGTAERHPFGTDRLEELMRLAHRGIKEIIGIQKATLGVPHR